MGGWRSPASNHISLRIDQLHDLGWDFKIWSFDSAWGWEWSTYFASCLGAVIADMVEAPTAPLLQTRGRPKEPARPWKRKSNIGTNGEQAENHMEVDSNVPSV